ncbi:hypothetical protein CHRYSEOSP005_02600 [Chryseobacterium sp. Alg-005]|uniref:hypothetical protein n=1 Tax=Chryseobacterium sp. Alg-005 TaxID=3159516 RepID=UPI0035558B21
MIGEELDCLELMLKFWRLMIYYGPLENNGITLTDDVLKGFLGYNKNIIKQEYMIRCGDCQLILKDVVFLEKITKFK